MSIADFMIFLNGILVGMSNFWNMFSAFSVAGVAWTRWLLLIVGASVVLGIVKHSISDAGGVTLTNTVNTIRGGNNK